jgi:hypothetical protein
MVCRVEGQKSKLSGFSLRFSIRVLGLGSRA